MVSFVLPEDFSLEDFFRSVEAGAEVKLVARQSKSTRLFLFDAQQARSDMMVPITTISPLNYLSCNLV